MKTSLEKELPKDFFKKLFDKYQPCNKMQVCADFEPSTRDNKTVCYWQDVNGNCEFKIKFK